MALITELPVEILQAIGSLLSVRSKSSFLLTHRDARKAFYNDNVEQREFWNLIIEDKKWFDRLNSSGIKIALVGADLQFITDTERPEWDNLLVALVLIWPRGKSLYDSITPQSLPARFKDRKRFWRDHPKLYQRYLADRRCVRSETLKGLLSALRPGTYDECTSEVKFPGFSVHIGTGIKHTNLDNMMRLLLPAENRTLVLYYKGGPSPVRLSQVEFPYGCNSLLYVKERGKTIAQFMDSSKII